MRYLFLILAAVLFFGCPEKPEPDPKPDNPLLWDNNPPPPPHPLIFPMGADFDLSAEFRALAEGDTLPYYFLIPEIGTGKRIATGEVEESTGDSIRVIDGFRPKYISNRKDLCKGWLDIGFEPYFLVVISMTVEQRDSLAAQLDVVSFPQDIDNSIPNQATLDLVVSRLETRHIPANWITLSTTWRQVLRAILTCTLLYQRWEPLFGGTLFETDVDFDKTVGNGVTKRENDIPLLVRDKLIILADSFQMDKSGFTRNSTLREVLRAMYQQWTGDYLIGCGETL